MSLPVPDAERFVAPEDFERWCLDPVTRFVAAAFAEMVAVQQAEWERLSWIGGTCDPLALMELRTRADCYGAFGETGWLDYASRLSERPRWKTYFEGLAKAERTDRRERKAHGS